MIYVIIYFIFNLGALSVLLEDFNKMYDKEDVDGETYYLMIIMVVLFHPFIMLHKFIKGE